MSEISSASIVRPRRQSRTTFSDVRSQLSATTQAIGRRCAPEWMKRVLRRTLSFRSQASRGGTTSESHDAGSQTRCTTPPDGSLTPTQPVKTPSLSPIAAATDVTSIQAGLHDSASTGLQPGTFDGAYIKASLVNSQIVDRNMERLTNNLRSDIAQWTVTQQDPTSQKALDSTPRQYSFKREMETDDSLHRKLREIVADSIIAQIERQTTEMGADLTEDQFRELVISQQADLDIRPDGPYAVVGPCSCPGPSALGSKSTVEGRRIPVPKLRSPTDRKYFYEAEWETNSANASNLADKLGSTLHAINEGCLDRVQESLIDPSDGEMLQSIASTYDLERAYDSIAKEATRKLIKKELSTQTEKRKEDGRSGQGTASGIFFVPRINRDLPVSQAGSQTRATDPRGPECLVFDWHSNGYFDGASPEDLPPPIEFSTIGGNGEDCKRQKTGAKSTAIISA
ncbi:hypothetical protein I316_00838 [Kwoniella heveanensis BCC8398]|uniref:Uncharacterized protein n=1 Tax=Kwoniella heveanensis BCC8398 TaxID=1296120 RepID=A0A1B9H366_9TREE|nr:hypothetical protein I316_00838 [Kwoniella heveanensis BCC8398]